MLRRAGKKEQFAGRSALADARWLPMADEVLDVVFCSFALGSMPSVRVAIAELGRVTKRGGRVIVSDLHPGTEQHLWRSSFRNGKRVYEVAQHRHDAEEFLAAGRAAGLQLLGRLEPRFGEPEREIFRRAGKEGEFESARRVPAVSILIWERCRRATRRV